MSATQISAGLGLLKKVLPDLSAVTVSGDEDGPPIKIELSETEAARRIAFTLAKATK